MKSFYIIPFFALFFFLGCRADKKNSTTNDPAISSRYYFRYLEEEKNLKTEATFLQGDSLENAVAKTYSGVFFNDQEMTFKKISDANQRYILNIVSEFPANGLRFSFINDKGQKETQPFSFSSMKNLVAKGPVSKSNGVTITWEGEPLGPQESVICLFSDKNNRTTNTVLKGPTDSALINIPAENLSALTIGEGKFYFVRKSRIGKAETNRSISAVFEYYTSAIGIEVVK